MKINSTVIGIAIALGLIWGAASLGSSFGASRVVVDDSPGFKEFNVVMENNTYNPSELVVNLGDTVTINFTNKDNVAHAVELPEFGASIPGGHVQPGVPVSMTFVAAEKVVLDAATCGGPNPSDTTDDHGEKLIVEVI